MADRPVVLITGGARRIGAEIARHLHSKGATIALHYRNSRQEAEALGSELEALASTTTSLHQADLDQMDAAAELIRSVLERHGRLSAVINNASTFYPTPIGTIGEREWNELIGSNLRAPLMLSQAAAAALREAGGAIINIVDIHAERPMKGFPLYSVAKAGLAMLTRSLARELAPEVRVNGVSPGAILWPESSGNEQIQQQIVERIALKRPGEPADIARTVAFLLFDAPYITGQIIQVDGGRTLQF